MDPLPFESDEGKTGWQVEARLAKRRDAAGNEHRPTKRRKANRSVPRKLLIQQLLPGVADTIVWTSALRMLFNVKELDKMVFGVPTNVPSAILGECWFSNYAICP